MIKINDKPFNPYARTEYAQKELSEFHARLGPKITPYFTSNGEGLWYYLNYFVYANHWFPNRPGLEFCLNLIRTLNGIKARKITIDADDCWGPVVARCTKILLSDKKIEVEYIGTGKKRNHPLFDYKNSLRIAVKGRILLNYLIGLFRRVIGVGQSEREKKADVLFLENLRFIDPKTKKNIFFNDIKDELRKQRIKTKSIYYAPLPEVIYLKKLIRSFLMDERPFLGDYMRTDMFSKNRKFSRKIRTLWKKADNNPKFHALFTYKGRCFYKIIRPNLEYLAEVFSLIAAENHYISKKILEKEHYDILIIDGEENQYAKGLMLNSRNKRKTVALTHEQLFPGSLQTRTKDKESNDQTKPSWRPIPNKKCVWGVFMRDVLVNHLGYPPSVVAITGNPRLDHALSRQYLKKKLQKKYAFSKKKKYILIVSTLDYPDMNIYRRLAKENPDWEWVIKAHPGENEKRLLQELKNAPNNLSIKPQTANIYELISISDAVMSTHSSVGAETAIMGTPVIILNLHKENLDKKPYVPNKEGIEITDIKDVPKALKKLTNKQERERLIKQLSQFAKYIHQRRDGKASKRIASEIRKILS